MIYAMAGTITKSSLTDLVKLGSGGQGIVYASAHTRTDYADDVAYKHYKSSVLPSVNTASLAKMPAFLESLSYKDGNFLIKHAAWPCVLVTDQGKCSGFIMPKIPRKFFIDINSVKGTHTVAAEMQFLLNDTTYLQNRGIELNDHQRYTILLKTAQVLAFLHNHHITVGDLSPKNILYYLAPTSEDTDIYFVDCDAMTINGQSIMPQLETPGWGVPKNIYNEKEQLATTFSDVYKFALLTLRLLTGSQDASNPASLPGTPANAIIKTHLTHVLSAAPHDRGSITEWEDILLRARRIASRQQHRQHSFTTPPHPQTPGADTVNNTKTTTATTNTHHHAWQPDNARSRYTSTPVGKTFANNRSTPPTSPSTPLGYASNFSNSQHDIDLLNAIQFSASVKKVRKLLDCGANPNAQTSEGDTALILAAKSGWSKVVDLLLDRDAHTNAANRNGETALMMAAHKGCPLTLQTLLDRGADIHAADRHGQTALMKAAQEDATATRTLSIRTLIKYGADPNAADRHGQTALMQAAQRGYPKVVQTLLEYGANPNLADQDGETALMKATKEGHTGVARYRTQIIRLLINCGAAIDARDNNGKTALDKTGQDVLRNLLTSYSKKLSALPPNYP